MGARQRTAFALAALMLAVTVAAWPRGVAGADDRRANDYSIEVRPPVNVSALASMPPDCWPEPTDPSLQREANVEPRLAANPRRPSQLTAVWQQGRWEDGGAATIGAATSFDGGETWQPSPASFTTCAGGPFFRASDPWVTYTVDGAALQMALVVTGRPFEAGIESGMAVSRSDDGVTWAPIVTLARDPRPLFHDKNSITADPNDPTRVYAVWSTTGAATPDDRQLIATPQGGAAEAQRQSRLADLRANFTTQLARSTDGGRSWAPARAIGGPAIGNQIIGLPNGDLINVFRLVQPPGAEPNGQIRLGSRFAPALMVARSTDFGDGWTEPITVTSSLSNERLPEREPRLRAPTLPEIAAHPLDASILVAYATGQSAEGGAQRILVARSGDGGQTWGAAQPVNRTPNPRSAWLPNIAVLADGTIGVTYYDFRRAVPVGEAPLGDFWLVTCRDECDQTANWREAHLAGPFQLAQAPRSGDAYFLGDYMGLVGAGQTFHALFALPGDNRRSADIWHVAAVANSAR